MVAQTGFKVREHVENDCVNRICHVLKKHRQTLHIAADVRPGCSSTLRKKWDELTDGSSLRLQPQIDILLEAKNRTEEPILCGIEVKYFNKKENKFNWPFYAGLDEAIAILNYGVDHAALWHIFSSSIEETDLLRYGGPFWVHIAKLGLPIEYTMMVDKGQDFLIYNLRPNGNLLELYPLCNLSEISITFKHLNPIKDQPFQSKLKNVLSEWWKSKK